MTPPRAATRTIDARRVAPVVALSVVCLTLLFSVQDAMRRALGGAPVNWGHTLALNALDWVTWGVLLPFIVIVGNRIRLDGSGSRAARTLGWLALALAFCAVQATLTGLIIRYTNPAFFGLAPPPGVNQRPVAAFVVSWMLATSTFNLLIFGMTAGVFHALLYYRDLRRRQRRETDLEARLARAELNVLRMQLQPHFLFNALHTVSSLMVSDVPTAQRVVASLGDLLRSSLDHTASQEIPLGEELAFVQRYLDIQRARFRQRLKVSVDVPEELRRALVPSLVLQPLVENAIRHGIEPSAGGGCVSISAATSDGAIVLSIENDVLDDSHPADDRARGSGVGLANVEARLAQLYGGAQSFRATRTADGRFAVTLTLPSHTDVGRFPVTSPPIEVAR